jgi:gamma-glutamylcyclotransferase (GGCT)/AIG2-like uncharacterized protein YtfP
MQAIRYFAFGSNMLTEWLRSRCPSAHPRGIASVAGYTLVFSKRSIDKSGKAMLAASGDPAARVYGVLYDIDAGEIEALDRSEGRGKGYERLEDFEVRAEPGDETVRALAYMADSTAVDASLRPYDWYLRLAVKGAELHGLPGESIARLRASPSAPDPDPDRPTKKRALAILAALEKTA